MQTTSPEFEFLDLPDDEVMAMTSPPPSPQTAEAADAGETTPPSPAASSAEGELREEGVADGSTPPAPAGEANADVATPSPSELDRADDADDSTPLPAAAQVPPVQVGDTTPTTAATSPPAASEEAGKLDESTPPAQPEKPKAPTPEDHQALYNLLLGAPIKANGKEIHLQSPDEAVKLVQMGLNYTKKMQAMQPALRVVKMLENNGLLDETKLSHLIDISKGDSGAIQKLLADKGFDPMSADAEQAAKYAPADHRVTPLEMQFDAVLQEVEQTPSGIELITEVHGQWDDDSKRALFAKPEILTKLAEQKSLGLYAQISGEMDRLRALGQITPDIPFLQAYHAVGEMLHDQGRLVNADGVTPPAAIAPPVPVETRVAAPAAPAVKNTAQAQATAPVRTAPSNPRPSVIDYLSMDDAKFAEHMGPRV